MLSVSISLAIIGILAFAIGREGAMSAQAVEAQYDTEVARYLAEAGLNLAKWRNQKAGCGIAANLPATSFAGIGTVSASVTTGKSKVLNIVATGTSTAGAQFQISRDKVVVHDLTRPTPATLGTGAGNTDTFINSDYPTTPMAGLTYLELTQGKETGLIKFSTAGIPADAGIISASLKLYQYQSNSVQSGLAVGVYRILADWDGAGTTWTAARPKNAWSQPGGDYSAAPGASVAINGNGSYSWDVTALLDGWINGGFSNFGLLLRPDGPLQQARFASFENGANKPAISVMYLPPC